MTDFENTFLTDGGAFDEPSEKDFIAVHVLGAPDVELPDEVNLNILDHTHNQGKSMHCTAYGMTHVEEIMNTLEHQMQALADPEEQWANEVYYQGESYKEKMEKEGTSLQVALRTLQKYGLNNKNPALNLDKYWIDSYARIEDTLEDIKKWLAAGFALLTGSGNHCYCLCGYSNKTEELIYLDSKGRSSSRPRGEARVPFDKANRLFSKYVVYDKKDIPMIFKDVSEKSPMAKNIKRMRDLGIMKGFGISGDPTQRSFLPERPLTRAEMAEVLGNFIDKFGLRTAE